jgi:hypothetical protein
VRAEKFAGVFDGGQVLGGAAVARQKRASSSSGEQPACSVGPRLGLQEERSGSLLALPPLLIEEEAQGLKESQRRWRAWEAKTDAAGHASARCRSSQSTKPQRRRRSE